MIKEMRYTNYIRLELLDSGVYRNRKYFIISQGTHPCAYVEFNNEFERGSDLWYETPCHGGITFDDYAYWDENDETYYIGWDYAHLGDYLPFKDDGKKWTTKEILENVKEVIDYLNKFVEKEEENENKIN